MEQKTEMKKEILYFPLQYIKAVMLPAAFNSIIQHDSDIYITVYNVR